MADTPLTQEERTDRMLAVMESPSSTASDQLREVIEMERAALTHTRENLKFASAVASGLWHRAQEASSAKRTELLERSARAGLEALAIATILERKHEGIDSMLEILASQPPAQARSKVTLENVEEAAAAIELQTGKPASVRAIGRKLGVSGSYVARLRREAAPSA
jgi:hypothetical protein